MLSLMIDPHASHFYQRDYFHLNFYLSQKSLKMLGGLKTGCDFKRKRLKLDKSIYELQFMFENFDSLDYLCVHSLSPKVVLFSWCAALS